MNVSSDTGGAFAIVAPYGFAKKAKPRPSPVFDTYWRFAVERQEIFFRRLQGQPSPWTADRVLREHKFTNAYRASDRVSQYLIRHVIYDTTRSIDDTLFRILLFKFFNKIETWELLVRSLGEISWSTYRFADYDRVLAKAIDSGKRIYSAAYIMPAFNPLKFTERKHRGHLRLIEEIIQNGTASKLANLRSMAEGFALFRSVPMLGDFLAYQLVTDVNYSQITEYSEMDFTIPGPGARDGIRKTFTDLGELAPADAIRYMADRQCDEFSRLGLVFRSLWGRPLQLIDCQNLFCEVDKYARVNHPEIIGITGRTRIKQKHRPINTSIVPFYPPKWGINKSIRSSVQSQDGRGEEDGLFAFALAT